LLPVSDFSQKFEALQLSTFATQSTQSGHGACIAAVEMKLIFASGGNEQPLVWRHRTFG
jgi:hypothetical protein